jgi:hypothetical protein
MTVRVPPQPDTKRCVVCGGWRSSRCLCGGEPDVNTTLEQLVRWGTSVDRAVAHGRRAE